MVLAGAAKNGLALHHASAELKADRAVVRRSCWALAHGTVQLSKLVLAALEENGWALKFASEELKANRDVVLAAVRQNGGASEHAAEALSQGTPRRRPCRFSRKRSLLGARVRSAEI